MKEYIERAILPQYDAFDSAHKRDHAETVIRNSIELSQYYPVEINMVYVIAAYHDTGLSVSRKWHHIISKENILKDNELSRWFYKNQIEIMAQAVEDHRASSGIEPRSIYGKIIAEADRDIEPLKIIQRTVQYGLSNYPELDKESQWERAKEHLKEKYGKGGYLKLWLPESSNAIKLKELREIIVDEERLKHLFEVYFDKNNNDNKRN